MKIKKWEISLLIGLILCILFSCISFTATCENIREDVFRLHILANSDSEEDQNLKLCVRDAILEQTAYLFENNQTVEESMQAARQNLDLLQRTAEEVIVQKGFNYSVQVEIGKDYFETRTYGEITLPAGEYEALRILIGEAKGHNWWCVLYPVMCINACGATPADEVLSENEYDVVHNKDKYQIRFKTVEWLESIFNLF